MWSDNETEVDLLGFEYLVDELLVALTNPALLPLTVGVQGEWGSGKSSLLAITQHELATSDSGKYLTIAFSPWQHEDYDDIKLALLKAVLDACERELGDSPRLRGLKKFLKVMGSVGRRVAQFGVRTSAAAASAYLATEGGIDPQTASMLTSATGTAAEILDEEFQKGAKAEEVEPVLTLEAFRDNYAKLVDELESKAVVVFIDDLDRCLPNTVVDTFEAIRLFLNAPKTAFVVAVHRQLAEAAVDAAFVDYGKINGNGLGHDYLEKMLQVQISVPRLSDDEAASYVGLLLAGLHLSVPDHGRVLDAVKARRAAQPFARSFDAQVATDVLSDPLADELRNDLEWAEAVVPFVNGVLRANPRQIKRFLNDLRIRQSAASRRGVDLRPGVLAKLLALHEADFEAFQTLFDWQLFVAGPVPELAAAEATIAVPGTNTSTTETPLAEVAVRDPDTAQQTDNEHEERSSVWAQRSTVERWLSLEPPLGHEDIRPYFTYFRSKLVVAPQLARLPESLQILLGRLGSDVPAVRRQAADDFAGLTPGEQQKIWVIIESYLRVRPDSVWFDSAGEIARRTPSIASALIALLMGTADNTIPATKVFSLMSRLPDSDEKSALRGKWSSSPIRALSKAAAIATPKKGA